MHHHIHSPNPPNHFPLSPPPRHLLLPPRHLLLPPRHLRRRHVTTSSSFQSLISQIPPLLALAPALGFASGLAIYFSNNPNNSNNNSINNSDNNNSINLNNNNSSNLNSSSNSSDLVEGTGEWMLFTSATPFNRFVSLRCPSIDVKGGELKEEMHFGVIRGRGRGEGGEELVYRRVCVGTGDGGVISIDWPVDLELEGARGLDTTVVMVPGTTEGSGERCVREFVCECLRSGWFPVVVNPRGCAGSPLTTPRLFSAADSDDVSTAIEYIKKTRPWSTMVAVGWGYGANMLTKYLAEVGEQTPLTATTCINNPFDLEEATRCSPHNNVYDKKLTIGLIEILQSNKELFQGRTKTFDVVKALSSTSVRDFEKAISMVSYGFDSLEEFYAKSSTIHAVKKVKIPTLFIQIDDGSVPVFSVPRHLIAENPFTSLLLCSSFPSSKLLTARLTLSWCQHLTIEWLTAVELGLLKGRHPLVMDVDVTMTPKGIISPDKRVSGIERSSGKKLPYMLTSNASDEPSLDLTDPRSSPKRISQIQNNQTSNENNGRVHKASAINVVPVDEGGNPAEGENRQVLQTAQVVMNMLDETMPGTLTDEQKEEVLTAVDQGESVMKAFQDAVPENVREDLTTAVSDILQNKSFNIKLDELFHLQDIRNVASGLRPNVQEKVESPHAECKKDDSNSTQIRSDDSLVSSQPTTGNHDLEHQASKDLEKPIHTEQSHLNRGNGSDTSASEKDIGTVEDTDRGMTDIKHSLNVDSGPETVSKPKSSSQSEGAGLTHDSVEKNEVVLDDEKSELDLTDSNSDPQHEKIIADSTADKENTSADKENTSADKENTSADKENTSADKEKTSADKENTSVTTHIEDKPIPAASSTEMQLNNESSENHEKDVGDIQPSHSENSSSSPSFDVSQALDAFTGVDDSTQLAVNNVFHVIEDMITHLADEKDNKTKDKDEKNIEKQEIVSSSVEHVEHNNDKMEGTSIRPDVADDLPSDIKELSGEESTQKPNTLDKCGNDTFQDDSNNSDTISMMSDSKPLDLESTSALFLEHFREENQWNLLEKIDNEPPKEPCNDIVEPSYIIQDAKEHEPDEQLAVSEVHDKASRGYIFSVKTFIMDALEVEVGRRLSSTYMQEMKSDLSGDIEHVANAVCLALKDEEPLPNMKVLGSSSEEISIHQGEHVTRAVSSALLETVILRETLPVGVVVGSCLATLKKYSNVEVEDCSSETEEHNTIQSKSGKFKEADCVVVEEVGPKDELDNKGYESKGDANSPPSNAAVVGAMSAASAAVGASALLVHQQGKESNGVSYESMKEKKNAQQKPASSDRKLSGKSNDNLVTSLAEKAMSVAGPVVPTKEDGHVDQEKLVAMLAEVGQKGGMRLFGRFALLWGGIRGAMSLTDKLISFLHMAELPLYQRISGFFCMVLVAWSPVVVPLLPSLVQGWATRSTSKFTDLTCIAGLYASIFMLITSWGRRIHGYENPLKHYGLDLNSSVKVQEFLMGLIGGFILVLLIQSLNFTLGYANLHYPAAALPLPSSGVLIWIKVYGKMLFLVIKGLATATGISLVEELLFRSWLPDEIASDLGYHQGIIISGLLFSLFQRSPLAIPGLWLLSLVLTGARERCKGRLWLPIGLRSGILASSFIIQKSGYITYQPFFPLWVTGTHPLQPFSGIIGLTTALVLSLFLYPRQQHQGKRLNRPIRD